RGPRRGCARGRPAEPGLRPWCRSAFLLPEKAAGSLAGGRVILTEQAALGMTPTCQGVQGVRQGVLVWLLVVWSLPHTYHDLLQQVRDLLWALALPMKLEHGRAEGLPGVRGAQGILKPFFEAHVFASGSNRSAAVQLPPRPCAGQGVL